MWRITARCSICLFGVCPCCLPVLTWTNLSACGCLLAPLSALPLTTRAIRSQHNILSNSCMLVRAPRPLRRCRPPHESHMVQRLQVLCPAHRSHSVLPIHRFRRAPPALSQVTSCQPRSLRLPRSSPLPNSWSVASLSVLPRRPSYQSPPHLWMPLRRLFHTPLPLETFQRNSRSGSSWLHLLRLMFSALRVIDQSPRYFLMRLCRRLYTASLLMMPQHNYRSRSSSLGAPSPMTLLTAKPRHRHIAMRATPHLHNLLTLLRFAVPAAPATPATVMRTLRPHVCHHSRLRVSRSMPVSASHMVYLSKPPRCVLVCVHPSQSRLHSHISVPPMWEHTLCAQLPPTREVQVPPQREPTILLVQTLVRDLDLFLSLGPWFFPWSKFGQAKPDGLGHIDTADSDLMHHQFRLSLLQWNPGLVRRNPTNIIAAACGRFHAVILQEASDHVPHISDQFIAHTGNTDLAILLNKDTFEPDPMVLAFREDSTSRGTWSMVLIVVRALLRRPSLSGTPTVTFCSVHNHNVVAKKRDASTELLQRLQGYMKQHNVDFIGGDFNMSAFTTVDDV